MTNYQQKAARTLINKPDFDITDEQVMIVWNAVGLAGEAGEVVDTIKKAIFHQQGLDVDQVANELGDVLWYIAALCTKLDLDLEAVMDRNIQKLHIRYPGSYNPDDSAARADLEYTSSQEPQQQIINHLAKSHRPQTIKEITQAINQPYEEVRTQVGILIAQARIDGSSGPGFWLVETAEEEQTP